MSFPSINPAVKCVFRWYKDPGYRTRLSNDCKLDTTHCGWAVITGRQTSLPFQFLAGTGASLGQSTPTAWRLMSLEGDVLFDMEDSLPLLSVESFAANSDFSLPARDYIICDEEFDPGYGLATGVYEMEIDTPGGTYYSETFRVCGDDDCLHRMTWRSCGDVGTQRYFNRDFTNVFYWDCASTFVGKPTPVFEEEQDKNTKGDKIPTSRRKDVRWSIEFADVVWPILDSISEMPLHDTITLQLAGHDSADVIRNVVMETTWNTGETCDATAAITFEVDEATSVTGCCDSFVPACPTPCVEADGIWPTHTPSIGETFLMPSGKYGIFYGLDEEVERIDADGFGSFQLCPNRFATTTQEGYEYVYFANGEWHQAIEILEINDEGAGTYLVVTNGWGSYGVQFEYTIDGSTWVDVPGVFGFGDSYIELPTGTLCVRSSIVSEDCTVATSAPTTVLDGFVMVAGDISGTYVWTGGFYNSRKWYVLLGADQGDEMSIYNSCVYEIGLGWVFSDQFANIIYSCNEDVTDPTQCVTWTDDGGSGSAPFPVLSGIEC